MPPQIKPPSNPTIIRKRNKLGIGLSGSSGLTAGDAHGYRRLSKITEKSHRRDIVTIRDSFSAANDQCQARRADFS